MIEQKKKRNESKRNEWREEKTNEEETSIVFGSFLIRTMFRLICLVVSLLNHSIFAHPQSSVRHLRLATNHRQYLIECPYNFNRLTLKFFNYSSEHCAQLYSSSNQRNLYRSHSSPYLFRAKPILLHCHRSVYSTQVEITYQCSSSPTRSISSSSSPLIPTPGLLILLGLFVFFLLILLWCLWHISIPSVPPRHCCLHVNPLETRATLSFHRR